ncbi:hypothetical protein [Sediminicurvatus halobius]|uniref:Phage tail tape measure protein n=1 Tax=Sediminicurvatus halobius TaxID=2182432 RepID=A0A2U2N1C6_9GAMM|nr:hypothetical protein [Spiribacter halobius]PWG62863.1 hypothetical protein DEM34_10885 [Spiribacter halobius]UEX76985.1 hypothetical protein LMH63_13665 [Spiribacter halobius]
MAELKASVILDLVDRISRPVQRIQRRFGRLAQSAGLQRLRRSAVAVGEGFSNVLSSAGRLTRRLALAGGAAAGAVWGFERLVASVTDAADAAVKTADRLGINVETLQEWQYAAELSGVRQSTFNMALQRFTRRAAEAANGTGEAEGALRFLNIQLRDTNGNIRPTTELFPEVADALAEIEDPALRVRAAFKLFDSEGVAVLQMLEDGSEGLRRMAREAHEAGVVMDEAFARKAVDYTDNMTAFRRTLFGLRIAVVRELLPAVTDWLERTRELIQANREVITERIMQGLRRFWSVVLQVSGALSWAAERMGGWGRLALVAAAIVSGPLILAITQLGIAIGGFGVALLATPIGWFLAGVAALAGAAYLIYRHWGPISDFVSELWGRVVSAFQGALDWIKDILDPAALMEVGRAWINGLWNGITERFNAMTNWLQERVRSLVDWMPDWVQDRLGLEGMGAPQMGAPTLEGDDAAAVGPGEARVGGELRITIDSEGRPRVRELRREGGMDIGVDLGVGVMP